MGYGPLPDAPDSSVALLPGPWQHRMVRANGIALHIAELGDGPLVLFLHGFPQFWWAWRHQLCAVADAGYRAVAVDLRGYGASDKPPRGYDVPTLARDTIGLIGALGESDADVVGTDVGGLLACTMAVLSPRVVRGLALIGSAHPVPMRHAVFHDKAQRRASRYATRTFQVPRRPEHLLSGGRDYARGLFAEWSGAGWRASDGYRDEVERYAEALQIHPVGYCAAEYFRWMFRSQLRPDGRRFTETLARPIAAPTLQLHGAADSCVLASTAHGSRAYISAPYEWQTLDGVGHFPHNEAPEAVSRALLNWLRQH